MKGNVKVERMNKSEALEWGQKNTGRLILDPENQIFFRHADLFLKNFEKIKLDILNALEIELKDIKHFTSMKSNNKNPYYIKRITADSLNRSLKDNMRNNITNIKFEVEFEEGIFFDSPKTGGFDFGLFDETYNLINFRNYCFGRRAIHHGSNKWKAELSTRTDWNDLANFHDLNSHEHGVDVPYNKEIPTIVGEVQFGNWALVYYDILKTIQMEQTFEIDLFIYITAAGNLKKMISDGTVNLRGIENALDEFKSIIKFPIWVIGVDYE